jgi:hypothetical protein
MQAIEQGHVVRVHRGAYDHYGVYVGQELVLQLGAAELKKAAASIHYAPFADFTKQDAFEAVEIPGQDLAATMVRAIWLWENPPPMKYHLLAHNCEHVARWCATGTAASHQVRDALTINVALGVGGVFAIIDQPDRLWAWVGSFLLLLFGLVVDWFSNRHARRFEKHIRENQPGLP